MAKRTIVFQSSSTFEAQMMAEQMKRHGLHPVLDGEHLAATVGLGAFVAPCRVSLPNNEVDEARALMAVWEAELSKPSKAGPSLCAACGAAWEPGFDVCWKCQTAR